MKITAATLIEMVEPMHYCGGGQYIIRGSWGEMREKLIVLPELSPRQPAGVVHRVYAYPKMVAPDVPWPAESVKVWQLAGKLPAAIRTRGKLEPEANLVMLGPPPGNS